MTGRERNLPRPNPKMSRERSESHGGLPVARVGAHGSGAASTQQSQLPRRQGRAESIPAEPGSKVMVTRTPQSAAAMPTEFIVGGAREGLRSVPLVNSEARWLRGASCSGGSRQSVVTWEDAFR